MAVSEKSISDKIETSSILEELKKEHENNALDFDTKFSHKEDLEKLLHLAEELKENYDKAKIRLKKYRILQIIGIILFLISTLYVLLFYKDYSDNYRYLIITIALNSLIYIYGFYQLFLTIKGIRKQHISEELALSEVLQLLRETSNVIAEQEKWSVLSRVEFRIRLSRFNLEEKSKSALSFFS
jgi:hypothetical protein